MVANLTQILNFKANFHLDNHCYPYISPSHCKDSHMLHIKNGSKSNTNSQLQSQFSPRILTIFNKKNYANNGVHFKIVSIIKKH